MNTKTLMNFEVFYSDKINDMTLQEAQDMHYAINPQFTQWFKFEDKIVQDLIKSHDISHVIYGCNTTYEGEMQVQFWNNTGSKQSIDLRQAPKVLINKALRAIVFPDTLLPYIFGNIGHIIAIRNKARKQALLMTKKWIYFQEDQYMNKKVGDIRKEYNIQLLLHS